MNQLQLKFDFIEVCQESDGIELVGRTTDARPVTWVLTWPQAKQLVMDLESKLPSNWRSVFRQGAQE
jgi:hypothetical protein